MIDLKTTDKSTVFSGKCRSRGIPSNVHNLIYWPHIWIDNPQVKILTASHLDRSYGMKLLFITDMRRPVSRFASMLLPNRVFNVARSSVKDTGVLPVNWMPPLTSILKFLTDRELFTSCIPIIASVMWTLLNMDSAKKHCSHVISDYLDSCLMNFTQMTEHRQRQKAYSIKTDKHKRFSYNRGTIWHYV